MSWLLVALETIRTVRKCRCRPSQFAGRSWPVITAQAQPFLDGLSLRSLPSETVAAPPPRSALRDPIQHGRILQRIIYKATPLPGALASPGRCLPAGVGDQPSCSRRTPAGPQTVPSPPPSCNLTLHLAFQLRCRGGRSDVKFWGLKIPPARTFPTPFPMKQKF